ncbi:MAG TPA: hypothetical protein VHB47_08135 [Thermoanaerobaculia bacterium]|jgi:hypothetical protein|nr:hypothetical protein [Thermoanaerobaculia bacterium]
MGKRILLGSLVGSVVVFVVSSAWHLTPGLGQIGVKALPAEETVLAGLSTSIALAVCPRSGLHSR